MSGIDKAVILAAGRGNRIADATRGVPKPLLPLDGHAGSPTFLDWHLTMLSRVGCREIYLVGNRDTFGTHLAAMDQVAATWILNPTDDLSTSGSAHSAQYAWHSAHRILDGRGRVLLMDADILYDPALLHRLATPRGTRSKTLVSAHHDPGDEEVLVFARPDDRSRAVLHGKGLLGSPLTDGLVCVGEATGILLFEPSAHAALAAATDWAIQRSRGGTRSEHEDVTQLLMARGDVDIVTFDDAAFMECDTPEEYAVLREDLYPRLRHHLTPTLSRSGG
ncbi:MAG TPA: NTP transferase domain-containing protein [Nocardioidaceae bacterium]|nr:NTP transferase domain-containing protein [Nocardioidaceae bacterium]